VLGDVAQDAGAGLGRDLDKGVVGGIGRREQLGRGGDHQLAEDRAEARGREEVRLLVPADALEVPRVIARRRVIHRQLHVAGKGHPRGRIGLGGEDFEEVGRGSHF